MAELDLLNGPVTIAAIDLCIYGSFCLLVSRACHFLPNKNSASKELEALLSNGERIEFRVSNSLDHPLIIFRLHFQGVRGLAESHILLDRQNIDSNAALDAAFLSRDPRWSIPIRQIGMSDQNIRSMRFPHPECYGYFVRNFYYS